MEQSELEFWVVPSPKPGRMVIVQRWMKSGGWDAYLPISASKTEEAIEQVLRAVVKIQQPEPVAVVRSASGSRKLLVWATNAMRDACPIGTKLYGQSE